MKKFPLAIFGTLAALLAISGCSFLTMGYNRQYGSPVTAQYAGLADKTVAIVVYVDQAESYEYPQARSEISNFVATTMRQAMPKIKLVDPKLVIQWQDETLNWASISEKEIGKHFGVDRVVYIEVIDYGTREPGASDLLRGRLQTTCKVFETETPGSTAVWNQPLRVFWPENGPMDATQGSDLAVRQHVLEAFSSQLTGAFYDHRDVEPSAREKMQ